MSGYVPATDAPPVCVDCQRTVPASTSVAASILMALAMGWQPVGETCARLRLRRLRGCPMVSRWPAAGPTPERK